MAVSIPIYFFDGTKFLNITKPMKISLGSDNDSTETKCWIGKDHYYAIAFNTNDDANKKVARNQIWTAKYRDIITVILGHKIHSFFGDDGLLKSIQTNGEKRFFVFKPRVNKLIVDSIEHELPNQKKNDDLLKPKKTIQKKKKEANKKS